MKTLEIRAKNITIYNGLRLKDAKKLKTIKIYTKKIKYAGAELAAAKRLLYPYAAKNCKIYVTSEKIKQQILKNLPKKQKGRYKFIIMK